MKRVAAGRPDIMRPVRIRRQAANLRVLTPMMPFPMANARRDRTASRASAPRTVARRAPLTPDWPTLVMAVLGLLLTGYLGLVALNENAPAFCTAGSGCDLVQQSRWSRLFGIPIALWGFGLYLLLAVTALFANAKVKSWRRRWSLALIGVAVSVYLTLVAAISLQAWCGWCLVSFGLLVAIFVRLCLQRPSTAPGAPWKTIAINHAIVLAAVLGTMHVAQSGMLVRPEDPRLKALAEHLQARGAKFYGASWCPNCQDQKDLFGRSAERLPYVECSPNGRTGAVAFACVTANITAYPTWIVRGRTYNEVLAPEELARRSGFDWEGFTPPAED
jgi:uncharacterized membrane protein